MEESNPASRVRHLVQLFSVHISPCQSCQHVYHVRQFHYYYYYYLQTIKLVTLAVLLQQMGSAGIKEHHKSHTAPEFSHLSPFY